MHLLIWSRSLLPSGFFDEEQTGVETTWRPDLDIYELPDEFLLSLSLPGMRPEDVSMTLIGRTLVLSGERKPAIPEGAVARLIESIGGHFERRIRLPANAGVGGIRTEMKDGLLLLNVPKTQPRSIEISALAGG